MRPLQDVGGNKDAICRNKVKATYQAIHNFTEKRKYIVLNKRIFPFLVIAAMLSGCDYTSGTNVTTDQVKQFTVGVSTLSQVEAQLGQPTDTTTNSDGTQAVTYQFNNTHQDALNYMPIVGLVHSHVEQTSNKTMFIFSRAGILQSYSTGSGNSGMANH